jgi:hypothetical protein
LRHRPHELLIAFDPALGNGQLRIQFRNLRPLVTQLDGACHWPDVGQYFALNHAPAADRHAFRTRVDSSGERSLHTSAGFRIGNDRAVQLFAGRQRRVFHRYGANAQSSLDRFGHEQAAVGQTSRAFLPDTDGDGSRLVGGGGRRLRVVLIAVRKDLDGDGGNNQQRKARLIFPVQHHRVLLI